MSSTPSSSSSSRTFRHPSGQRRRQYVASRNILEQHGASMVVLEAAAADGTKAGVGAVDRTSHPTAGDDGNGENSNVILGITLCGWKVTTWQGTIAHEQWLDEMTNQCEALAQPQQAAVVEDYVGKDKGSSDDHHRQQQQQQQQQQRRKLTLPEMVFGVAHVTVEHEQQQLQLGWDTEHALMEWARAHASIPLRDDDWMQQQQQQQSVTTLREEAATSTASTVESGLPIHFNVTTTTTTQPRQQTVTTPIEETTGVTILQSMDAALWNTKRLQQISSSSKSKTASAAATVNATTLDVSFSKATSLSPSSPIENDAAVVFQYDWTYSTPYSGHVNLRKGDDDVQVETDDAAAASTFEATASTFEATASHSVHKIHWKSLSSSGINVQLLTDQSIPILYYDEIILLEDDLHDNGQVQYSVKLRVMPHCIYILAKLWLRVDNVILRLRETRLLVEFLNVVADSHNKIQNKCDNDSHPTPLSSSSSCPFRIHRDITWRECTWNDLPKYSLPTAVSAWCGETNRPNIINNNNKNLPHHHQFSHHRRPHYQQQHQPPQNQQQGMDSPEFRARLAQLPTQQILPSNLSPHSVFESF